MNIAKRHLPKRINNPQERIKPAGIVLHYIGNPSTTAAQNAAYFSHVNSAISVHYIVDDNAIIEIIPPEYKSYGTSDKYYNERYIQIEMCHPDNTGKPTQKTLNNTIWLCRKLMKDFGISKIIRHYDVTGKLCPRWYIDRDRWESLKAEIFKEEEMEYNYTLEVPEWARATIQKLLDKGYLKGDEHGRLGLNDTMIKLLVINDRAGLYD